VSLKDLGLKTPSEILDLWTGAKIEAKDGSVTAMVPVHGVLLLRFNP
jgi:hypothetical protein